MRHIINWVQNQFYAKSHEDKKDEPIYGHELDDSEEEEKRFTFSETREHDKQERPSSSSYSGEKVAHGETSEESLNRSTGQDKGKRRPRKFYPKDYQLLGGKTIGNAQRSQGARFLMAWAAKPGIKSWLSEEEIVEHFPEAAQEYLVQLKEECPRKWATIIKKAGPMVRFILGHMR